MLKRRTVLLSVLAFVAILVALLFGFRPHLNSPAPMLRPLLVFALLLNLGWLVLYLLVWRKNLARANNAGWYLVGSGLFVVAVVMLLCVVGLSFSSG